MPKRSIKRRRAIPHNPAPAPRAARSHPHRALIRIDNQPIRDAARQAYERARQNLAKAEADLEHFRTQERPAFDRWVHANFGKLLTELREADRKRMEQEDLLTEIEVYSRIKGVSEAEAYIAVMHRRANPGADPEPPPDFSGPPPSGSAGDNDEADDDFASDEPDFSSKADQDAFREFARSFEDFFGQKIPPGVLPFGTPPPARKTATVKDLYRTLVRKLHPDTQETMTAQKLEWWHEVQEAYAANDADRLEVILSQVELASGEPGTQTSVSMFNRLTARLRSSLREIKRELTEIRQDPAWNFTRTRDRSVLAARTRQQFSQELRSIRCDIDEDAATLALIAEEARQLTARRSRPGKKKADRKQPPRPNTGTSQNEFQF